MIYDNADNVSLKSTDCWDMIGSERTDFGDGSVPDPASPLASSPRDTFGNLPRILALEFYYT